MGWRNGGRLRLRWAAVGGGMVDAPGGGGLRWEKGEWSKKPVVSGFDKKRGAGWSKMTAMSGFFAKTAIKWTKKPVMCGIVRLFHTLVAFLTKIPGFTGEGGYVRIMVQIQKRENMFLQIGYNGSYRQRKATKGGETCLKSILH